MARMMSFILLIAWLGACISQTPQPSGPVMPEQVPMIADNQWRLTEVIYNGEQGNFDSIEPVLATFHPGLVAMKACNGTSFVFDTESSDPVNGYRLMQGVGTARECDNGGTEQEGFISNALLATSSYEIVGDTLVFSGKNAQLTFVIDNKARKPLDWQ